MKEIVLPIQNFPAQDSIFRCSARYIIVAKGRRFGLTKGAANDFIECALERKFQYGLWVDVINANIERYVQRYFIPHLNKLPENMWHWHKQEKTLKILDSTIDFRSADNPQSLEGFGYHKAFLNEAGIILRDEYLWHNSIRPMLWEHKPKTVIGGTPKGKGLFNELYLRGEDDKQPLYANFRFTTFDNPYLDGESIRKEIESLPENVVKQEIYAEFLEDSGVVFRNISEVLTAHPQPPIGHHVYVMGVDLAKVQDFTVITVFNRNTQAQVYQDRFNKLDWNYQKKKIAEISSHYNGALVHIDATGVGDPIVEDLVRIGVPVEPFKFTNDSKKELVEKMMIWFEQKKVTLLPIKETRLELESFTYDISSTGKVRYNAPVGFHDDIVMAIGLAIQGLYERDKIEPKEPVSRIKQEMLRRSIHVSEEDYDDYEAI